MEALKDFKQENNGIRFAFRMINPLWHEKWIEKKIRDCGNKLAYSLSSNFSVSLHNGVLL